jgi:hypothetical protein
MKSTAPTPGDAAKSLGGSFSQAGVTFGLEAVLKLLDIFNNLGYTIAFNQQSRRGLALKELGSKSNRVNLKTKLGKGDSPRPGFLAAGTGFGVHRLQPLPLIHHPAHPPFLPLRQAPELFGFTWV